MTVDKQDLKFELAPPYRSSINNPFIRFVRLFQDWFFVLVLNCSLKRSTSVLDVGCGYNSPLRFFRKNIRSCGIDIYRKCILVSRQKKIHKQYINGDIRRLRKYFSDKHYDSLVTFDVIEHLTRKEGQKLLADMEKIAVRNVMVMTPNGKHKQDAYDGNPYQAHKSSWNINDFYKQGYQVYGLRGWKKIRGEYGAIYRKPWIFWAFLAFITEPLLFLHPEASYDLFAIKKINN